MNDRPSHLSDDHHIAIARVAIEASRLEWQIEKTIESAFRQQPTVGAFLLKNLGSDRIVELLKAALLDLHPDETPDSRIAASARPYRDFQFKPWTISEIRDKANEMRFTCSALVQWRDLLHERFRKPSPDIP